MPGLCGADDLFISSAGLSVLATNGDDGGDWCWAESNG